MRILLADAQTKVRFALRVLLERQPGFEVLGAAASAGELVALAVETGPDLVLLGWNLAGAGAADLLRDLRVVCPGAQVIVLSGRPEVRELALAAGADAFVSKGNPPEHLLAAIAGCCRDRETEATEQGVFREPLVVTPPPMNDWREQR